MQTEVRIDPYGKKRSMTLINCSECGKEHWLYTRFIGRSKKHYCSIECRHKGHNIKVMLKCDFCKNSFERPPSKIKSKSNYQFCSRECKDKAQRIENGFNEIHPSHYGTGTEYREKAIRHYGKSCELCGWSHTTQVHHIDGNRQNNDINNLIVLCPNCHSLTESNKQFSGMASIEVVESVEKRIREKRS